MTKLTFGTVICTYKRPHLLEQCLASWNSSMALPDQVIVVDATPNAKKYASQFTQQFPQLFSRANSQYLITDQPGLTRQRNLGLSKITTDLVCFTDDDTFVTPTYQSKIVEVFQHDTKGFIGGINGVAKGQFDHWVKKNIRLGKNLLRHRLGWLAQRIHAPGSQTHLFDPIPATLRQIPLISIDRLWGANMNYRTDLIFDSGFDESFQRYGLFEDVDISMRAGKTHKLVCRLDAEIIHDDALGQTTRPADAQYFLSSWVNAAYIIEKLFPNAESRSAYRRYFNLTKLLSETAPSSMRSQKIRLLGNQELFELADKYVKEIESCENPQQLGNLFTSIQNRISSLQTMQVNH